MQVFQSPKPFSEICGVEQAKQRKCIEMPSGYSLSRTWKWGEWHWNWFIIDTQCCLEGLVLYQCQTDSTQSNSYEMYVQGYIHIFKLNRTKHTLTI